jgi:Cu+-exporting ATPase
MVDNKISIPEKVESKLSEFENMGKTAVLVSIDSNLSGILALADTLKNTAKIAVESLKSNGKEVIMLTGDNKRTANHIAAELGIKNVMSQVLPQQKEKVIAKLMSEKKIVAMVGDGINDAPALGSATRSRNIWVVTNVGSTCNGNEFCNCRW